MDNMFERFKRRQQKTKQKPFQQVLEQMNLDMQLKNQTIAFLSQTNESLNQKWQNAQLFIDLKDQTIHRLQLKIQQSNNYSDLLSGQLDRIKSREQGLQKQMEALRSQHGNYHEISYLLYLRDQELKQYAKYSKEEIYEYKNKCTKLQTQIKSLQEEIEKFTKQFIELEEYHQRAINQNEHFIQQIRHLKIINENYQQTNSELKTQLNNKSTLIDDYQMKLTQKQTKSQINPEKVSFVHVQNMQIRFNQLQKELIVELNQHKSYITSLKQYQFILLSKCNDILCELNKKEKELSRYRQDTLTHNMYIYKLQSDMKSYQSKIYTLQDKMIKQQDQMPTSQDKQIQKEQGKVHIKQKDVQCQLKIRVEQQLKFEKEKWINHIKAYILNRLQDIFYKPQATSAKNYDHTNVYTQLCDDNTSLCEVQFGALTYEDIDQSEQIQVMFQGQQTMGNEDDSFEVLQTSDEVVDKLKLMKKIIEILQDYGQM